MTDNYLIKQPSFSSVFGCVVLYVCVCGGGGRIGVKFVLHDVKEHHDEQRMLVHMLLHALDLKAILHYAVVVQQWQVPMLLLSFQASWN